MLPDPGNRAPAPEPLRLVQAFVNTVDVENGIEELTDAHALRDVLIRIGALAEESPRLTNDDLRVALEVREALRSVLHGNVGDPVDPRALRLLDGIGAHGGLRIRF